MSGNKFVLTLFKTNDYRDLLTMSLYMVVKYIVGGATYMYKIASLKLSQKETAYGRYCRALFLIKGKLYRENT